MKKTELSSSYGDRLRAFWEAVISPDSQMMACFQPGLSHLVSDKCLWVATFVRPPSAEKDPVVSLSGNWSVKIVVWDSYLGKKAAEIIPVAFDHKGRKVPLKKILFVSPEGAVIVVGAADAGIGVFEFSGREVLRMQSMPGSEGPKQFLLLEDALLVRMKADYLEAYRMVRRGGRLIEGEHLNISGMGSFPISFGGITAGMFKGGKYLAVAGLKEGRDITDNAYQLILYVRRDDEAVYDKAFDLSVRKPIIKVVDVVRTKGGATTVTVLLTKGRGTIWPDIKVKITIHEGLI